MKTDGARILVIGAGVNGSICAAELHKAGFDVTVLARGKRLEELCADGIIIENPLKKNRSVTRVPVVSVLKPDDHYDYVLVVVRKNQVRDLLPVLAANRSPAVVFMVNNPSGPDEWVAALGRERVMLGFVFGGGKRDGNVIRAIRGGSLSTPFGELDGAITSRLLRLVGILRGAGLKARAAKEMTDWLATHAALVAPFAVLAAATPTNWRRLLTTCGYLLARCARRCKYFEPRDVTLSPAAVPSSEVFPVSSWLPCLECFSPPRSLRSAEVGTVLRPPMRCTSLPPSSRY